MKKTIPFIIMLFWLVTAKSQNPYASLGKDTKVLTLSNGKYDEFISNDTIVPIGGVLLNTITGEVVAFIKEDTLHSEYSLKPEVVSRWLAPDPLAAKFSEWSPYNFVMDNPIIFIDPDGRDVILVIDGKTHRVTSDLSSIKDESLRLAVTRMVSNSLGAERWNQYVNDSNNDIYIGVVDGLAKSDGAGGMTIPNITRRKVGQVSTKNLGEDGTINFKDTEVSKAISDNFSGVKVLDDSKLIHLMLFDKEELENTQTGDEVAYHEMTLHVFFDPFGGVSEGADHMIGGLEFSSFDPWQMDGDKTINHSPDDVLRATVNGLNYLLNKYPDATDWYEKVRDGNMFQYNKAKGVEGYGNLQINEIKDDNGKVISVEAGNN